MPWNGHVTFTAKLIRLFRCRCIPVSTFPCKLVRFFIMNTFVGKNKTFQVESWKMVWTVSKYPVWMNAAVGACLWTPLRSLPFWFSFTMSIRSYSRSALVIVVLSAMLEKQDPTFTCTSNRMVNKWWEISSAPDYSYKNLKRIWNQKNFVVV